MQTTGIKPETVYLTSLHLLYAKKIPPMERHRFLQVPPLSTYNTDNTSVFLQATLQILRNARTCNLYLYL